MAFGVKVKLDVELVGEGKLRSQIQKAIEGATQDKPIKIRHLSVDLGRQETQRISKQLESAIASQNLTIKIAKIDASKPVADLKKQLTTMLSGLSITGLKDFLGTDGVAETYDKAAAAANRLAEAQANAQKKAEAANVALKTLKSLQSMLGSTFKGITSIGDTEKLKEYLQTYQELLAATESAKSKQGDAQNAEITRITAATAALRQKVSATIEAGKAEQNSAAEAEKAQKREADLLLQSTQLRKKMLDWKVSNPRAYAEYKGDFEALFASIESGASTSKASIAAARAEFERLDEAAKANSLLGNPLTRTLGTLRNTLGSTLNSMTSIGDEGKLKEYLETYRELLNAVESVKNLQVDAQNAEVDRIAAGTAALKKKIDAYFEEERAKRNSEATGERAAKREMDLARQAIQLKQRINTWIQNNSKAYAANKIEIDSLMALLQNESDISSASLAEIRKRFEEVNTSTQMAGISGKSFFDTLKAGWQKFGGWSIVTKTMMAAVNGVKSMVKAVIDLDSAMTELKKVTNLTSQAYGQFSNNAAQTAKKVGASVADTINATADFARLGYSVEEAASLAEAALVYKNVGDGISDIGTATESLISTMKAFGTEASDAMSIVDMFNEVGRFCPAA